MVNPVRGRPAKGTATTALGRSASNGVKRQVYLLAGKEEFFRKRAEEKIRASLFGKSPPALDYNIFFAGDVDIREALDCGRTPPFASSTRLVVLKQAERLRPEEREALISYCQVPPEKTLLLIETEESRPSDKFFSSFSSFAQVIFCKKLYGARLRTFIREEAGKFHKKIDEPAVRLLEENLGNDLGSLNEALNKLSLYLGDRSHISGPDAEKLVGQSVKNSTFDLVEAISEKKVIRSLRILTNLLEEGREAGEIIGLIGWQFRRIKKALKLKKNGREPKEVAADLGISNRFILERFLRQLKVWKIPEVEGKVEKLLYFDYQIKRGGLTERRGLELLLLELGLG